MIFTMFALKLKPARGENVDSNYARCRPFHSSIWRMKRTNDVVVWRVVQDKDHFIVRKNRYEPRYKATLLLHLINPSR